MRTSTSMVAPDAALSGRTTPLAIHRPHLIFGLPFDGTDPADAEVAYLALGCFWGAERRFWELPGVLFTSVGYQGGYTPNPTYEEVCSGLTGHAETVRVLFDPARVTYAQILARFFESHDPTQGMRQGNDVGTQYRSAIYTVSDSQRALAEQVASHYGQRLARAGFGPLTTEIAPAGPFYLAEEYHQQYLAANPQGYCGLGGTGVSCPVGLAVAD